MSSCNTKFIRIFLFVTILDIVSVIFVLCHFYAICIVQVSDVCVISFFLFTLFHEEICSTKFIRSLMFVTILDIVIGDVVSYLYYVMSYNVYCTSIRCLCFFCCCCCLLCSMNRSPVQNLSEVFCLLQS